MKGDVIGYCALTGEATQRLLDASPVTKLEVRPLEAHGCRKVRDKKSLM